MTTTLCASAAVVLKAGANAPTITDAQYTQLINQAEATIATVTRKDWVSTYSTMSSGAKLILEEACSNMAAQYAISYDMSGYTNRAEAETMLDVLNNGVNRALSVLRDLKQQTFIDKA